MKQWWLNIMLAVISFTAGAQESGLLSSMFDKANNAYASKEYTEAVELYEQIASTGNTSFELHYNLGCAYFKLGKMAESVLQFERAKRLQPANGDVLFNLELLESRQVDKVDVIPEFAMNTWWNRLVMAVHMDKLAWVSIGMALFAALCFIAYRRAASANQKRLWFAASLAFMVVMLGVWTISFAQLRHLENNKTGVIMMPSVTVKSSPDREATKLFVIHEGLKVKILDQHQDWFEIQLPDGKVGWLQGSTIAEI